MTQPPGAVIKAATDGRVSKGGFLPVGAWTPAGARIKREYLKENVSVKPPQQGGKWVAGGHSNDYIFFHMRKADGTYISVLNHGRIVDSVHNGRVFYVMIMDLKSLQRHYGDCLELVEK